jgi:glycosyltransferase involved in cell wall biosynthesis
MEKHAVHILFLTDNFPPESNAPANRTYEHAIRWVNKGSKVTVITCAPNFPSGKVFPGYRNRWYQREQMNGIDVVRVKTYITANERFLRRIMDYLSFMITGTIAALFQKKPDVIIATSPQFFCGVAGMVAATLRSKRFILEIRDLWPDSIVAVGMMRGSIAIRFLEWLEILLYKRADTIVVVTESFKRIISDRCGDAAKIEFIPNGIDSTKFYVAPRNEELRKSIGLQNKFVVGYIGTHGLAHNLCTVVEAARILSSSKPEISFLLVGTGADYENISASIGNYELKNVVLLGQQPRETVPDYLRLCDVSLIILRNTEVFSTVIPSKLFECMGVGISVLTSVPEGELTQIVKDRQCGECVEPESPELLAATIQSLADNPERLATQRENSLAAADYYSRDRLAHKMLDIIQDTGKETEQQNHSVKSK